MPKRPFTSENTLLAVDQRRQLQLPVAAGEALLAPVSTAGSGDPPQSVRRTRPSGEWLAGTVASAPALQPTSSTSTFGAGVWR